MTIDEAIKILDQWYSLDALLPLDKAQAALKLGINALRFYKKLNDSNTGEIQGNFLGEDPEK